MSAASKYLERHGWKLAERIRRGCMVSVFWYDPNTGARHDQYFAMQIQRSRKDIKTEAKR